MNYLEILKLAVPETIVVATALLILALDLLELRSLELRLRLGIGAMISCAGCLVAIGWMIVLPAQGNIAEGMFVADSLTQLVKVALLALAILTIVLSVETDFTEHVGEYFAMILLGAVGMMFLVSAEDILMVFIALELTSLSLYVLTAFNKRNLKSAEAALKYFLFGGMAAAFTLFGLSLLYGLSGSTNLGQIAMALRNGGLDSLAVVALVMIVVGFGFKIAAVPFHLWAPDAYEGAPTPSAAFIASGSKVASFFIFAKVLMLGFAGVAATSGWQAQLPWWTPTLAVVAAASMVLGNFVAIVQTSVRRLLAYSAIAHGGYMLLGVMACGDQGLGPLVYYVVTYAATAVGAFGVVSIVEQQTGGSRLSDFAGLSQRAPLLSFCMLIFMLSLAGIPPLAGFFGKFYLFSAALASGSGGMGLLWLVALAVATSAVSLYYYLQVLKQIYIQEPAAALEKRAPISGQLVTVLLAAAIVVLGCAPNLLVAKVTNRGATGGEVSLDHESRAGKGSGLGKAGVEFGQSGRARE
jgi:NADH-quinone oxidoreductase subunit N